MSPTPESTSLLKTVAQVEPVRVVLGGNNNLSALTVSPGSLVPAFSANTLNYTVNADSNVADVTVSATKADPNAMMSEDITAAAGTETGHKSIQLNGPGSNTRINIVVTAPNGTQKTYTVNVSRAALGGSARSTESFPYLSIGLGLLATIGALVYIVVFSQGLSPGKRDEAQYRPTGQSPSTSTEVSRSSSVPQPVQQPSTAPAQTKPTVKPGARPAKTITGKVDAPMVLVPAGEFMMGLRKDDKSGQNDERPAHPVFLDAY